MSEFIYFFRGPGETRSPQEMQHQLEKWMAWMKDLGDKGHIKGKGPRLDRSGKVVRKPGVVNDGPYAEAKDIVGGFLIVEAKDIDEAVALSEGCPIFESGGFIEVRPTLEL